MVHAVQAAPVAALKNPSLQEATILPVAVPVATQDVNDTTLTS